MKKLLIGLLFLLVISMFFVGTAMTNGGGAQVGSFTCWVYYPTVWPPPPDYELFSTEDSHYVSTPSGNKKIVCHFDHDLDLDKAVKYEGIPCGIDNELTFNSSVIFSPGGTATLTCEIKAKSK